MTDAIIRKAQERDLESICELARTTAQHLRDLQIDQWDEVYPRREDFQQDILQGALYVWEVHQKIAGCIVLNTQQEPEYSQLTWGCNDEPIGVVHRLMIRPCLQGQGVGKILMSYIEQTARQAGFRSIRLDAFAQNLGSVHFYKKLGYQSRGFVRFRKGEFICFEKAL